MSVGQTVKLPEGCAGKTARLRLAVWLRGLKPENKRAEGKPGACMGVWAFFRDGRNRELSKSLVTVFNRDADGWTGLTRRKGRVRPGPADSVDFRIPEGADNVRIDFKTTVRGLDAPAQVWVDSVELSILGE